MSESNQTVKSDLKIGRVNKPLAETKLQSHLGSSSKPDPFRDWNGMVHKYETHQLIAMQQNN